MLQGLQQGMGYGVGLWKPRTIAAVRSMTGYTPEHVYVCDEASGDLIDQIGSADLAVEAGVDRRVAHLPGAILGIEVGDGTAEDAGAGDSSVWDHGAEAWGFVFAMTGLEVGSGQRDVFGKRDGSKFQCRLSWRGDQDGDLTLQTFDGNNSVIVRPDRPVVPVETVVVAGAFDPADVLALAIAGADGVVVSQSADATSIVDAGNVGTTKLGSMTGFTAGIAFYCLYLFGGANANGMAADVANIARRAQRAIRRWQ